MAFKGWALDVLDETRGDRTLRGHVFTTEVEGRAWIAAKTDIYKLTYIKYNRRQCCGEIYGRKEIRRG